MANKHRKKNISFENGVLEIDGFVIAESLWAKLEEMDVDFTKIKEVILKNMGGKNIPHLGLAAFTKLEKVTFGEGIDSIPRLVFASEFVYEEGVEHSKANFKNLIEVDCGHIEKISEMAFWGSFVRKLVLHPENKNFRKVIRSCPSVMHLKFEDGCVILPKELTGSEVKYMSSVEFGDDCVISKDNFNQVTQLKMVKFGKNCEIRDSFCKCPKLRIIEIGSGSVVRASFTDEFKVDIIKLAEDIKFEGNESFGGKALVDSDRAREVLVTNAKGRVLYSMTQKTIKSKYSLRVWEDFPVPLQKKDVVKDSSRDSTGKPIYVDVIRYAIDRAKCAEKSTK